MVGEEQERILGVKSDLLDCLHLFQHFVSPFLSISMLTRKNRVWLPPQRQNSRWQVLLIICLSHYFSSKTTFQGFFFSFLINTVGKWLKWPMGAAKSCDRSDEVSLRQLYCSLSWLN